MEPVAAAALHVADVRRAADRAEIHDVPADVQVSRRVARVQHETLRGVGELGLDELAPKAHELVLLIHKRTGLAVKGSRRLVADLEPGLLEDAVGRLDDPLDLFPSQQLERRPRVGKAWDGREGRAGGARSAIARGTITSPRRSRRLRVRRPRGRRWIRWGHLQDSEAGVRRRATALTPG